MPQLLFEKIKLLQEKTGLSLDIIKKALDNSQRNVDQSLVWLRENKFLTYLSKKDILQKCADMADNWAEDFLASTQETGELQKYHSAGRLHVIRDNFFSFYVIGIPGRDPFLIFKDDLELLTEPEDDQFSEELKDLYENAVDRLLPLYIKKEPGL
jgi:hypothetical protein